MRKIKEMLRLHFEQGLGVRQIARSLSVSHSTVSDLLGRAEVAGLGWPLPGGLEEAALEAQLYPVSSGRPPKQSEPDMARVHRELSRKGVTLQLLWIEYKRDHPDGYQYSQFCEKYRKWRAGVEVVLHQTYRAGEKLFVDFAGQTVPVQDRSTGETREAQVFVAVLGASNYSYAEATWSQELGNWIMAHCRAFEFFGGVPAIVVPDNLRSGVSRPCRYEPDANPTYHEMTSYYGTVVIPARPRKPRDKAKVEKGVQVVENWILAAVRNRKFFSLDELNEAIAEGLEDLNRRAFQKLAGSRLSLYETVDRPALKPLPPARYEMAEWKKAKVNVDYHVAVDFNYYSVPYQLISEEMEVRFTANIVEIFFKGRRVASHRRVYGKGIYVTDPSHRPPDHAKQVEWTPSRMVRWAQEIGPSTGKFVEGMFARLENPEQGYRPVLGIMRLGQRYGFGRLEAACGRAVAIGAFSYQNVKSILEKGADRLPLPEAPAVEALPVHANVRGSAYFRVEREVV